MHSYCKFDEKIMCFCFLCISITMVMERIISSCFYAFNDIVDGQGNVRLRDILFNGNFDGKGKVVLVLVGCPRPWRPNGGSRASSWRFKAIGSQVATQTVQECFSQVIQSTSFSEILWSIHESKINRNLMDFIEHPIQSHPQINLKSRANHPN